MGILKTISFHLFELTWVAFLGVFPFIISNKEVLYVVLTGIAVAIIVILVRKALHRKLDLKGRVVLITGCDTGFGNAFARRLEYFGATVIAGCLNDESEGALRLRKSDKSAIHVIKLDITKENEVDKCLTTVKNICNGKGLWALINNAGMFKYGAVETCPVEDYRKILEVNVVGTLRMTKQCLPLIRASKGRVVTLTGASGLLALPGQSALCMATYSLEAMMDCLRLEVKPFGVKVITVRPGHFEGTTGFLNENTIKSIDETLKDSHNSLSTDTLSAYGEDYPETQHQKLTAISKSSAVSLLSVIDVVHNALDDENPKAGYLVDGGRQLFDSRNMLLRLQKYIPTSIFDSWRIRMF